MAAKRTERHSCGACRNWAVTVPLGESARALVEVDKHIAHCPDYRTGKNGGPR